MNVVAVHCATVYREDEICVIISGGMIASAVIAGTNDKINALAATLWRNMARVTEWVGEII